MSLHHTLATIFRQNTTLPFSATVPIRQLIPTVNAPHSVVNNRRPLPSVKLTPRKSCCEIRHLLQPVILPTTPPIYSRRATPKYYENTSSRATEISPLTTIVLSLHQDRNNKLINNNDIRPMLALLYN